MQGLKLAWLCRAGSPPLIQLGMVAVVVDMVDKVSRTVQRTKATLLPYAGVFFLQHILLIILFFLLQAVQVLLQELSDVFTELLHGQTQKGGGPPFTL